MTSHDAVNTDCSNLYSDLEPELDYLVSSQALSEVVASSMPVIGGSFCQCDRGEEGLDHIGHCLCGEEDQSFEWVWDRHFKSSKATLSCDDRKVSFYSNYSCGTAAIRGTQELADGQHFWEVKMTSPVYGTDMMVGIGTSDVDLDAFQYSFCSLLGHDESSWGLSYTGFLQHQGNKVKFSSRFGQGSIIGLHLDTWHGTLTFYKNRRCIGVAATGLQNNAFYPMVCSTAAKSSMKVIRSCHTPTSLQYLCCTRLRQVLPRCPDTLGALELPPGLRSLLHTRLGWVFSLSDGPGASEQQRLEEEEEEEVEEEEEDWPEDFHQEMNLPSSPSTVSTLSACDSPSPCTSPLPGTASYRCPCQSSPRAQPCPRLCPPTPPSSDGCCSEPEDYHSKRCRWT